MSPLWECSEIASACGGKVHGAFDANSVTFDSREVTPGALFIALSGAETDGHNFVEAAFAAGASGALVSRPVTGPHVLVPDTLAALRALGHAGRDRALNATVIGVTGSVGKTTVKELIRAVFAAQGPTHASVKSYNNHTGVPLSLARMPPETRWAVFEMGMNHAGEITALTAQVRPQVAVITAIAPAHIENLGSLKAIADAKAEIFDGLTQEGAAILPAQAPHANRLLAAARRYTDTVCTFGLLAEADFHPQDLIENAQGSSFLLTVDRARHAVRVPAPGRHRVLNALAAIAAVHAAGGDIDTAVAAIGEAAELAGRGARRTIRVGSGEALLIDESYNANPASMAAGLSVLAMTPAAGAKHAVLGAMRELGAHSDSYHRDLAPLIEAAGATDPILVGTEMAPLAATLPKAAHLPDWQAALAELRTRLRPGDVLLVKGSNSVGLGRLVAALETD